MLTSKKSPTAAQWSRIGIRHHHGINIPLFSLHSQNSLGIGEYPDLIPLIAWCREVGLDIIQLLPLNDTGIDSSPYSAISAFALNPIHVGLLALPGADKPPIPPELLELSATPHVDYKTVRKAKERFLRSYFQKEFSSWRESAAYTQFLITHRFWLDGYALFRALKDQHKWQPWRSWPTEDLSPNEHRLEDLRHQYRKEMDFHRFVQFLCFQQFEEVKKAARAASLLLKGDIPICCAAESADAWLHGEIFMPGYTAGAPADMYNQEGQNWGFPIYNWDELGRRNFDWWHERLRVAEHLYQIYRIDHIVGLFRIWAIPEGQQATQGGFIPADPSTWISKGRKTLEMLLASSQMLPIGEDLGTVPPEVRICLREMGVCGTKVMRWERAWLEDQRFFTPSSYIPESMTTVSTHDSETLTLWWQNQPEEAKIFAEFKRWLYSVPISQQYLFEILRESHYSGSLFHINLLNEYLALIPELVWPDPYMERINVPGTFSDRNWTYRFRPSVEEITTSRELHHLITHIVPQR